MLSKKNYINFALQLIFIITIFILSFTGKFDLSKVKYIFLVKNYSFIYLILLKQFIISSLFFFILSLIINKFAAGPVGLDTLATALGEERLTLEDMIEPYLLQQGFIMRTPRGRIATDLAFSHLGEVRANQSQDLFGK
mgnify:CR=1 FL=1